MSTQSDPALDTPSFARRERADLADLFDTVGQDAPTLCAGWNTSDLVAHLVVREGHPSAAGLVLPPLSGWMHSQQERLAAKPYAGLVERFRQGPPAWSLMRLPGAESALNTFEHFVHHEDVRRAQPSWVARDLTGDDQRTLWDQLARRIRLFVRKSPVPVRIQAPSLGSVSVGDTDQPSAVTLTGDPAELVLYLHGRRDQATIALEGTAESVERWQRHRLAV